MTRLRVAMVGACPYPVPQGSQVYLRDTALALEGTGHALHLVVYGYGLGEDTSGLRVHRSRRIVPSRKTSAGPSLAKPLLDLALTGTVRRVARSHGIEVAGAHNYEALLAVLASGVRPVVYHAHNAMADELPHYFGGSKFAGRIGRWLDRTFPKRADHVIAPHERLRDYLVECGCEAGRVSVIAPPCDGSLFRPPEERVAHPPVVYTGNLDGYQNLAFLGEVMKRVRDIRPEARLVIATAAGGAFDGADVIATPDLDALREVLRRDAVIVCPRTSWSGYPIKLLNAMAAGQAVVCSASAAYPLTDGVTGICVPDNDADGFAGAVIGLLDDGDRRASLGAAARARILSEHNPEKIGTALAAVYEGVMRGRK